MLDYRQVLYTLKREYGAALQLYQRGSDTANLLTGALSITETVYEISRAVSMPVLTFLKYFSHPMSGKFSYGGDLNIKRRAFIIDRRDLPLSLVVTNEFFLICQHTRYQIESVDDFDNFRECYVVIGKEVVGTDTMAQISVCLHDWIWPQDSAGRTFFADVSNTVVLSDSAGGTT